MKDNQPFKIDYHDNLEMMAVDVRLMIGGFKDKEDAKRFADVLSDWLVGESGWKMRAN